MTNRDVVKAWFMGTPMESGHLSTDGLKLHSYDLEIGFTGEDGCKYVRNYKSTADCDVFGNIVLGKFISKATSHHVGLARLYAFAVNPE